MRALLLLVGLAGFAGAQTMAEYGAAAAGGATGGAAGKSVSQGLSTIFGKVDKQTAAAAKQGQAKTGDTQARPTSKAVQPAPQNVAAVAAPTTAPANSHATPSATPASPRSSAKSAESNEVPEPPGTKKPVVHIAAKKPVQETTLIAAVPVPMLNMIYAPELPPPPVATLESLKTIKTGAAREDVLRLGAPSSRISMFDDGHMGEIYRYTANDMTFGVVRLNDGVVSAIELH
jgi:hypothetical protein